MNRELLQRVIGQEVMYFQILAEQTQTNDLYNEAVTKVHADPVVLNGLVYYENTTEQVSSLPPDSKFRLDLYLHVKELEERNLAPKMGDFVQFGEIVYEIYAVTQPQVIFGQIEQKMMTKCTCGPARKGQFAPVKRPLLPPSEDPNAPMYSMQPPGGRNKR